MNLLMLQFRRHSSVARLLRPTWTGVRVVIMGPVRSVMFVFVCRSTFRLPVLLFMVSMLLGARLCWVMTLLSVLIPVLCFRTGSVIWLASWF